MTGDGTPPRPHFGRAVKARRTELGLTVEQVALAAGFTPYDVSTVERRNRIALDPPRAHALAKALGWTVEQMEAAGGGKATVLGTRRKG
jgi:hypothetical protein